MACEKQRRYNATSVKMPPRLDQILVTWLILDLLWQLEALADISISTVGHVGPMIEGNQYTLQCDIYNVVNAQSFIVRWYKGQILVYNETFTDIIKTPVNITDTLQISPDRDDDGSQYRCEAELMGPAALQPSPQLKSQLLNITVHFKPTINETKLPSIVPVFRGYSEVLVCEAEGNPKPTIRWRYPNGTVISGGNLTITEATIGNGGFYNCTAGNYVNNTTRQVQVVLKEDYLPLIAGFVAVIVAVISAIFIFIYSIYYKTAKMGQYSLKDAKPCAQNGNIAQNGKDNTIPMKKLSQIDILA